MNNCECCGKETNNPKFCSKSCSAKIANKNKPKRLKKKSYCSVCGVEVSDRRTKCDEHNPFYIDWSKVTYKEICDRTNYQKNARIRSLCRVTYEKELTHCESCGYEKHVEIHHIKEISSFTPDTLISIINDRSNLKILCPNCHWEEHNMPLPKGSVLLF